MQLPRQRRVIPKRPSFGQLHNLRLQRLQIGPLDLMLGDAALDEVKCRLRDNTPPNTPTNTPPNTPYPQTRRLRAHPPH
eukprot:6048-Prorocentrum_minimum.AAC.7